MVTYIASTSKLMLISPETVEETIALEITSGAIPWKCSHKASPPGRHQEQAPKQRCTFRPTTFSSVQFSSVQFSSVHTARARQLWPFDVRRLPQILHAMPPGPERTRLEGVVDAYGAHADPGQLQECVVDAYGAHADPGQLQEGVQSQILTSLPFFQNGANCGVEMYFAVGS